MISIRNLILLSQKSELANIPKGKKLINTINAYSYNNARKDVLFEEALMKGDYLLPDGISIVQACRFLHYTKSKPKERVTGWDLFSYEMTTLNKEAVQTNETPYWKQMSPERERPVAMFMGSSEEVLSLIKKKAATTYPNIHVESYSPPYKPEFTVEDNLAIVQAINAVNPDVLWIGMTAPKQEKWTYGNWDRLNIHCHVGTIGAVFDFFAGTSKRAPLKWQQLGLEWLYRLLQEPKRMWRRYILGNTEYIFLVLREKLHL